MKAVNVQIPTYFKRLLSVNKGYIQSVEVLNEVFSAYFEELAKRGPESLYANVLDATMLKRHLLQMSSDIFESLGENPELEEIKIQDYSIDLLTWTSETQKGYFITLMAAFDAYCRSDYGRDVYGEFFGMLCQIRSAFVEMLFDIHEILSFGQDEAVTA